jgi:membrane-associated phospholipid phosphatase
MRPTAHAWPLTGKIGPRQPGLLIGAGVSVVFGLLLPWALRRPYPKWPWEAGALLVIAALLAPNALRRILEASARVGLLLNRFITLLIAATMFLLVITPAGWIMRIAGKDPMARRFDRDAPSYRVPSTKRDAGSMERPF